LRGEAGGAVTAAEIGTIFRREYGRAVSVLVRTCGSIDAAEEAVQDAFTVALERWPVSGLPESPAAWIITAARRQAIDRIRRERTRDARHQAAAWTTPAPARVEPELEEEAVGDERLRLVFTCCHPALARPAQIALTLRLLGGLSTDEIARAFLVPEATIAQRIVRAKRKIAQAGIPYRVPSASELPERLGPVLTVLYLIFNEGYAASTGPRLVRPELSDEAIRLTRALAALLPGEPEVPGLLALMLLADSRREARVDQNGAWVTLAEQDRTRWNHLQIAEGQAIVRACLQRNAPGPYQIQAAIQAVHSDAATAEATDWHQILALYDQLFAMTLTSVVAMNRAVALAEVEGAAAGLDALAGLALDRFHLFHAIRADLLLRTGAAEAAAAELDRAIASCTNQVDSAALERKRQAVTEPGESSRAPAMRSDPRLHPRS
jgi:RNA polymerase sigma-70 factor (ECF subfamily)